MGEYTTLALTLGLTAGLYITLIVLLALLIYFCIIKRRNKRKAKASSTDPDVESPQENNSVDPEVANNDAKELEKQKWKWFKLRRKKEEGSAETSADIRQEPPKRKWFKRKPKNKGSDDTNDNGVNERTVVGKDKNKNETNELSADTDQNHETTSTRSTIEVRRRVIDSPTEPESIIYVEVDKGSNRNGTVIGESSDPSPDTSPGLESSQEETPGTSTEVDNNIVYAEVIKSTTSNDIAIVTASRELTDQELPTDTPEDVPEVPPVVPRKNELLLKELKQVNTNK